MEDTVKSPMPLLETGSWQPLPDSSFIINLRPRVNSTNTMWLQICWAWGLGLKAQPAMAETALVVVTVSFYCFVYQVTPNRTVHFS